MKLDYSKYEEYFNTSEDSMNLSAITVQDTYQNELQKKMKSDIEEMGYIVKDINVKLNLEEGNITNVKLYAIKGEAKEENDNNIDISIDKVDIGSKKIENTLKQEEIESIKSKINADYGVDYANININ